MNPDVSFYESCRRQTGKPIPVLKFLDMVKNGEWEVPVLDIREAVAQAQDGEASAMKRKLPAVTFSGKFSGRKKGTLVAHSGLMVADIDNIGIEIEEARLKLSKSPYLYGMFVSPRGRGLKLVFRVPPDEATHSQMFFQVEAHIRDLSGLPIDNGKDVTRLCYASYDPNTFINPDAVEMPLPSVSEDQNPVDYPFDVTQTLQTDQTQQTLQDTLVGVWWRECVPTGPSQTNKLLFRLARKSLDVELRSGRSLTVAELKSALDSLLRATPAEFLTKSDTEYFDEFCRIRSYTKFPTSHNVLQEIWDAAVREVVGEAVFDNPKVNHLAKFCYLFSKRNGGLFFLSVHDAAKLLGVDPTQASRWLKTIQGAGLLEVVEPHDAAKRLATVYRWKGRL